MSMEDVCVRDCGSILASLFCFGFFICFFVWFLFLFFGCMIVCICLPLTLCVEGSVQHQLHRQHQIQWRGTGKDLLTVKQEAALLLKQKTQRDSSAH